MRTGLCAVGLLAIAAPAAAEPTVGGIRPDARALAEAREANLEPTSVREGFAVGIALGLAAQFGVGVSGASGGGGGFDLRLGAVASPRWVWLLSWPPPATPRTATGSTRARSSPLAGQLYVNEAFWLRGGLGFASFHRRDNPEPDLRGLGALGAGGLDVLRRGGLALSVELAVTVALYGGRNRRRGAPAPACPGTRPSTSSCWGPGVLEAQRPEEPGGRALRADAGDQGADPLDEAARPGGSARTRSRSRACSGR